MGLKYYLIAGEASGDLHGGRLIEAIKTKQPEAEFRAWGGEKMQAQGAHIVTHYREMAFMGFIEVIKNLGTILGLMKKAKADILAYQPDFLICIDYPGFNMRMAEFAKKHNIPVIYYIAPQVWAWKAHRVEKLKKTVDLMLCILPFEKDFFAKRGMEVEYVGHPLVDHVSWNPREKCNPPYSVALLPGSRKQEIEKILPEMTATAQLMSEVQFHIAVAPSQKEELYEKYMNRLENVHLHKTGVQNLLEKVDAALVTSGTATLETALSGVPQIVCYRTSWSSYRLAKFFIKVPFISLVNLIAGKEIVSEHIQDRCVAQELKPKLERLLHGNDRKLQLDDYDIMRNLLQGGAAEKAAELIVELAKKKSHE